MDLTSNSRPELTGEYLVVFVMDKVVKHLFGEKCSFVPQNNGGRQLPYPCVTFLKVTPHTYTTADHRPDQYYSRFQFDCHHPNDTVANQMADHLLDALTNDRAYRYWFQQVHVTPSPLDGNNSDVEPHTILAGINYDNAYGFDYRFTISQADKIYLEKDLNFKYELPIIKTVRATGRANTKKYIDADNDDYKEDI